MVKVLFVFRGLLCVGSCLCEGGNETQHSNIIGEDRNKVRQASKRF